MTMLNDPAIKYRPATPVAARRRGMASWKRALERSRGWLEPGRP